MSMYGQPKKKTCVTILLIFFTLEKHLSKQKKKAKEKSQR